MRVRSIAISCYCLALLFVGALTGCSSQSNLAEVFERDSLVLAGEHEIAEEGGDRAPASVGGGMQDAGQVVQARGDGHTAALPVSAFSDRPYLAPRAVGETDAPYLLDAGDRVRVFIYGQPNLSRIYTVDGSGFVAIPLIGAVKARGGTTFDLERAVTVQLGAKYVKDPKVSVEIALHRPFFILGEVRASGQYPYVSGMTAQTAVAIAGGFSDRAEEQEVVVTRRINGVIEKRQVPADTAIQPGDTIIVKERFF